MKYFGTDGIRGIPGKTLSLDLMKKIGKSLHLLNNTKVLIAYDTRITKDIVLSSLLEGLLDTDIKPLVLGVLSTPALIYYSRLYQATAIMITASHNPYYDNGIKIINKGNKLTKLEEEKIEEYIASLEIKKFKNIEYLSFLKLISKKTNLKIALDLANGSLYKIAKDVFQNITNNLLIIGDKPNGYNINDNLGSTHPDILKKVVLDNNFDIGFSFDGDGDRVICIDKNGTIINGDIIIYIIAKYLKLNNKLNKNKVVLTIMSNPGIIEAFKKLDIDVIEASVGDKNVYEEISKHSLSIGGEESGHIIISEYSNTGDGLLSAIILLNTLIDNNTTIEQEIKDIFLYHINYVNIS
ncbi:MAG: phosphoglucosamine mutase, partial [Acholeplasmatales bacterium]|nr:phosphoglucosamine mutase [Acholeplasmatales bacterium]